MSSLPVHAAMQVLNPDYHCGPSGSRSPAPGVGVGQIEQLLLAESVVPALVASFSSSKLVSSSSILSAAKSLCSLDSASHVPHGYLRTGQNLRKQRLERVGYVNRTASRLLDV